MASSLQSRIIASRGTAWHRTKAALERGNARTHEPPERNLGIISLSTISLILCLGSVVFSSLQCRHWTVSPGSVASDRHGRSSLQAPWYVVVIRLAERHE
eukprot:scaffold3199_cov165-Amphora_coffeaeformis.AAC.12